jgi:hypothetical protein
MRDLRLLRIVLIANSPKPFQTGVRGQETLGAGNPPYSIASYSPAWGNESVKAAGEA